MNYFILTASVLYSGGALFELLKGNYKLAGIYTCYIIANLILSTL